MLLARGDYSQIEARVGAWLSGAQWKLDGFAKADRKEGPGLYEIGAGAIFRVDPREITKDDPRRQVGKVSELALGFQGGVNALQNMCRAYGLVIPMHPRKADGSPDRSLEPDEGTDLWIVNRWRQGNPETADKHTGLWAQLEQAALACVKGKPGESYEAANGKLRFKRGARAMSLRLPSGRCLWYWSPGVKVRATPWGDFRESVTYYAEDAQTKRWTIFDAYGGLWTENAVQATARDVMRDALLQCEADGLRPLLTVHDEAICEVAETNPKRAAARVRDAMTRVPEWAAGLPLAVDASAGPRYVKA